MFTRRVRVAAFAACGLFWSSVALAQVPASAWSADGATGSLALVAAETDASGVTFTFKNVTQKAITALVVSRGNVDSAVDFFESEAPKDLPPGESYRLRSGPNIDRAASDMQIVHIRAVLFQDGTTDGSTQHVNLINGRRAGRILEQERIRQILERPVAGHVGPAGIEALAEELGKLPASEDDALSSVSGVQVAGLSADGIRNGDRMARIGFRGGVSTAREDALFKLQQLKALPGAANAGVANGGAQDLFLSELRKTYERLAARNAAVSGTLGARRQQ